MKTGRFGLATWVLCMGLAGTAFAQGQAPAPTTSPPPGVAAPSAPAPAPYPPPPVYAYPAPAGGYPGYGYPPPLPPPPMPDVSITISPLHLFAPIVELTAEFRVGENVGIAGIGGVGSIKSGGTRFTAFELGGQLRYYALGDFHRGLHLGAELLYMRVSGDIGTVSGIGSGLAIGPMLGWKSTWDAGFTFEIQGGVEMLTLGAETTDGRTASGVEWIPLLNINIGWSI